MKKHIPNAITCTHLFSGCTGIFFAFQGKLDYAAYAVFTAAFFDFLDGMAARLLKVHSKIGKQLDSLADMVSFGVLPAFIIFMLLAEKDFGVEPNWTCFSAFFIAIFSALRLAKFNVDTRQTNSFIGLPTPASAMLSASFPLILIFQQNASFTGIILNHWFLIIYIAVNCWLLVAELPLLSLKFKNLDFSENSYRYILLFFGLISLLIFKFAAIPFIIFFYILLSIIQIRTTKK